MEFLFSSGLILLVLIVAGLALFFYFVPVGLWITAYFSGVRLKLLRDLVGMRLRKVPPHLIVKPLITAHKAGIYLETAQLEAHYLAGGNVQKVVNALISADKANIDLTFERAAAIDLAGRDVYEAVQVSVNPKVIETPPVSAVAKDGIQVRAIARVTVRANIERLVGGAGEETIIARVGEGIVSTIGSADSHKEVLENPDRISKTVLEKGLDAGTAFEILSIDIATWTSARTSGLSCRPTRPRPTCAWRAPKPKSDGRPPWRVSRRCGRSCRRCGPRWLRPRPRSRRRSPRRCATATWACSTTTTCATSRPTPRCAGPSAVRPRRTRTAPEPTGDTTARSRRRAE